MRDLCIILYNSGEYNILIILPVNMGKVIDILHEYALLFNLQNRKTFVMLVDSHSANRDPFIFRQFHIYI